MKDFLDYNFEALVIILGVLFLLLFLNNLTVVITFIVRPIRAYFKNRRTEKAQISVLTRSNPKPGRFKLKFKIKTPKFLKFKLPRIHIKIRVKIPGAKILRHPYMYYFINIFLICFIWFVVYSIQYRQPCVIASSPENGGQLAGAEDEITVQFSRPVNTSALEMNLGPDISGVWERGKLFGVLPLTTEMTFHPKETVVPDDDMILYVVGFNPIDIGEHLIEFKSAPAPSLIGANIEDNQQMVPVDGGIEFDFDREIGNSVEYTVQVDPAIDYHLEKRGEKLLVIPETRLSLNTEYTVKLFRSKVAYKIDTLEPIQRTDPENIYSLKFKTDEIALIDSVSPSGTGVLADTQAHIKFGKQVDEANIESHLQFEPKADFEVQWESDTDLVITPTEPLQKATKYQLILEAGVTYDQTQTMFDYKFEFETIGYVRVNQFTPENNAVGRAINTRVQVQFNQEVDHGSAQAAFEVSPNASGTFSWDGNTMIFTPGGLSYQTKYSVKVKAGIKTVYGLDSNEEFSTGFTTQSEITSISVPYYRQVLRFECEVLAFRMIMAKRGIYLSNSQVLAGVGQDTTPYNSANNTWGDPYVHFVGDITGSSKGYGVHLQPLARVAQSYGRSVRVGSGWSVQDVTNEVAKGNPVMILAQNGYSTPTNISWRTPEGKYIHAINGTHAYVVVGFKGSASNPTAMLLQDPWYRGGSKRWFTMSYFNSLWSYHSNSALVVY